MIDNKEKDTYILSEKALGMSKYQRIFFNLLEKDNYYKLVRKIVKEIEKDNPNFIISLPICLYVYLLYM